MCLEEQAWKLIVLRHTSRDISELEEQRRAPLQRGGYWKRNVGILKLFFFSSRVVNLFLIIRILCVLSRRINGNKTPELRQQ